MQDYFISLNTAFSSWLTTQGFVCNGKTITNIYEGNFDSPKISSNLPCIEFEMDTQNTSPMTSTSEMTEIIISLNVWMSGNLNANTKKYTRQTCKSIERAFRASTSFSSYGVIGIDTTSRIDGEPLYTNTSVGCALELRFYGRNSINE